MVTVMQRILTPLFGLRQLLSSKTHGASRGCGRPSPMSLETPSLRMVGQAFVRIYSRRGLLRYFFLVTDKFVESKAIVGFLSSLPYQQLCSCGCVFECIVMFLSQMQSISVASVPSSCHPSIPTMEYSLCYIFSPGGSDRWHQCHQADGKVVASRVE